MLSLGHGGIGTVARGTGISRFTISRGLREVRAGKRIEPGRFRRPGGGRTPTARKDPKLVQDSDALVEPTSSGHPQSSARWVSRSTRRLARELRATGHNVSSRLVGAASRFVDGNHPLPRNLHP
ncbi:MAG: ISAzo13-like element transposase-related protein [Thermoplasmata archaeon]